MELIEGLIEGIDGLNYNYSHSLELPINVPTFSTTSYLTIVNKKQIQVALGSITGIVL